MKAYSEHPASSLENTDKTISIIPPTDVSNTSVLIDNTWGLAIEKPSSQEDNIFYSLPQAQDNAITLTDSNYEETSAGNTYTAYYGIYVTPDIPAGTYTGATINYIVEENITTNIIFNGNGNDGGTGMGDLVLAAGNTAALPANTYIKDGYFFAGWNTSADGSGTSYEDQAEFTAPDEPTNITLYAQWEVLCAVNTICYRGNGASSATNMDNVVQYTTGVSL